jgi:hypothetical protein
MTLCIPLTAIVVGGLAFGLWLHHVFEGEWLPYDLAREYRLSRKSLRAMDEAWAKTKNRSDIVITLTTTPSRINLLDHTLKSLLDQSRPPGRIVLNLPAYSAREQTAYVLPDRLKHLSCLDVQPCDDLGPGTKLIPRLGSEAPDTPLLVLDDDRIYPHWLIERYEQAMKDHPEHALTMAGWVVPENLTDEPTTIRTSWLMLPPAPIRAPRLRAPREIDVMLGVMSYLVKPRFFDNCEMQALDDGPSALRYVDDVRTSALCRVPKLVIPALSLSFVPWRHRNAFQSTRLGLMNRGPGERGERHNTIAIRHYANKWRVGGPRR